MPVDIPGYKIIKKIGQGGMATVYLAKQTGLDREVALKVMSPKLALDPSFSDRFIREGRIIAKLSHPRITQVYDVGVHNDTYYLAMKFYPGGELKDQIKKGIALPRILKIIAQVADALNYAHENGYVHRDVKPENILFNKSGDAILSDFGIARNANSQTNMTQTGLVIGTPVYMSPEQAKGEDLDGRSDIYSLGIMFFEMLSGNVPYNADSGVAIAVKHLTEPVPTLDENLIVFQPIINRFLSKSADKRYQTGHEIIADLKAAKEQIIANRSSSGTVITPIISSSSLTKKSDAGIYNSTKSRKTKRTILFAITGITTVAAIATITSYLFLANPDKQAPPEPITEVQKTDEIKTEKPKKNKALDKLIALSNKAFDEERYISPSNDNARLYLRQLLEIDQQNSFAIEKLELINEIYQKQTLIFIAERDFDSAQKTLNNIDKTSALYNETATFITKATESINTPDITEKPTEAKTPIKDNNKDRVQTLLSQAETSMNAYNWTEPKKDNALYYYKLILNIDSNNKQAKDGIEDIFNKLIYSANKHIEQNKLSTAAKRINSAKEIYPNHNDITELANKLKLARKNRQNIQLEQNQIRQQKIKQLLAEAKKQNYNNNAKETYKQILELEPRNTQAIQGLKKIEDNNNIQLAKKEIASGKFDSAKNRLALISNHPQKTILTELLNKKIDEQLAAKIEIANLLKKADGQINKKQWGSARKTYKAILKKDHNNKSAKSGLKKADDGYYLSLAKKAIGNKDFDRAESHLTKVSPNNRELDKVRKKITEERNKNKNKKPTIQIY